MAIWYAGQGGAVGNTGQSYAQRKALVSQLTLASGDTVFMCAAAAGPSNFWLNTEQLIVQSDVTYRVYPMHYVLMDVDTPNLNEGAIHAVNKTGFTIEPTDGFLELGDDGDWDPVSSWFTYQADRQLNFLNCSNFRLIGTGTGNWNTTASNFIVHGGRRYVANQFDVDCDLYLVRGLEFSNHGTNNNSAVVGAANAADDGNMVSFSGTRAYIHKVCVTRAGHAAYSSAAGVVVKECDFDGDWTGYTPNEDAGRQDAAIQRSGQRCFSLTGGNTDMDDNNGGQSPWGPQMFDDCIFRNAGSAGDDHDNAGCEIYGNHVIVRFCYFWDGCNDSFRAGTFESLFPTGSVNHQKVYNNTSYGNGKLFDFRNNDVTLQAFQQISVINNIFDDLRGSYFAVSGAEHSIHYPGNSLDGWPDQWKGARYAGNLCFMRSSAVAVPGWPAGTIVIRGSTIGGAQTEYSLATITSAFPTIWYNNVVGSPTYTGTPSAGTRTKAAFAPNGGAAVGNAEPHAIAGAGSGTTTLTVGSSESRLFFDGWDMESFGLQADWIKIGAGAPVQIATNGINYGTDQIGLTSSRTWTPGDEVYLCLTPDGVNFTIVADIGAGQTPGATIPATGIGGYEVLLGESVGGIPTGVYQIVDVGNVLTKTFTGLTSGREYYFRVRAYDLAGNLGEFTSPRVFATTL